MRRQLLPAFGMLLVFTVLTGVVYPLAVTVFAKAFFAGAADGSLVRVDGEVVGSRWIGQSFTKPEYFHGRPDAFDGALGIATNYGPTNPALVGNVPDLSIDDDTNPYAHPDDPFCLPVAKLEADGSEVVDEHGAVVYEQQDDGTYVCHPGTIPQRVLAYRAENGLSDDVEVPIDAVTGSGSSLDPHISVANAHLQAPRVARARGLPVDQVLQLVDDHTDPRALGFLGEPGVDVLELNIALDRRDA